MPTIQNSSLTATERIKLIAQIKLRDSFDDGGIAALNAISSSIIPHLYDHFMLVNDLRLGLQEEFRRLYFDYSFVLFPVHKAFECFLNGVFGIVFRFELSKGKNVGYYLSYTDEEKDKVLNEMLKLPWGKKISKDKWVARWKALAEQWAINRNPLTHPEQERILSLTKVEQIAGAIIREMEISLKIFKDEFLDPLINFINEQEKQEAVKRNELAKKISG
jgi:hypothetical protein